jgi:aspartyl/asparaginyl-tRNA synthetase
MIARTLSVDVGPERLDAVIETYRDVVRPIHERATGLHAHFVLANRDQGRIAFVGVWDSIGAVQAVAPELEPARERLWQAFGEAPNVEVFDVVDWLENRR